MKAFFILSIVVPVGLLATFRLTGVLPGSIPISETITLDTITWSTPRPNNSIAQIVFDHKLGRQYSSTELTAGLYLIVSDYIENSSTISYDTLRIVIAIDLNVTNPQGFVHSLSVIFRNDSKTSWVEFNDVNMNLENLSLKDIGGESNPEAYMKAYVNLDGTDHNGNIYFWAAGKWTFLSDPSDESHQIEAIYELTYYNGTVYKKTTQPFQLILVGG